MGRKTLNLIAADVEECRSCPRLVDWREKVGREKRAAFRDWDYWARGVPGFGDPDARLLVVGLAPSAHGANRTGRMFTGDASGDWLYAALHRAGYANQPESTHGGDGLALSGVWITAPVKCAPPGNMPSIEERDNCEPYFRRELRALGNLRVVLALGGYAHKAVWSVLGSGPRPKFGHGVEAIQPGGMALLCSYHVSRQNTNTRRLTEPMLDDVFKRARELEGMNG